MKDRVVHTYQSEDGLLLRFRPLSPDDARHLVDLFQHMGSESRFLRFNVALTDPDMRMVWAEARRMARVDPTKDGAWLVFADLPEQPEAPVAGGRYVRLETDTAEVSLAVRDDMQNKGIGTELVRFVVAKAREAGIRTLTATVQRHNRALWRLLHKSSLQYTIDSEGGYSTVTADLMKQETAP